MIRPRAGRGFPGRLVQALVFTGACTLASWVLLRAGAPSWLVISLCIVAGLCYLTASVLDAIRAELTRIAQKVIDKQPLTDYEAAVMARLHDVPDDAGSLQ